MSLLSTFAILFETDAEDAAEDVSKLSDDLDDLKESSDKAAKSTDNVSKSVNSSSQSLGSLAMSLAKVGAAYFSFSAIASGILDSALAIDTVGKFSEVIDVNVTKLDAWGVAVARSGGSTDQFFGSLENLNQSLSEVKLGDGNDAIKTMEKLGVSAKDASGNIRSSFDVLPDLAEAFATLSTSESFGLGKKIGLDRGTILLLQQGRVAVEDLVERQQKLGGVTEEGYQIAAKFNDQFDDTKRVFSSLWMSANTTILPMLTKFMSGLEVIAIWVRENEDLVKGFFIGVASVLTYMYLPAMIAVAKATIAATWPFIAIAAAIAAFGVAIAIAYEDVVAWVNGSDSLLGDMIGTFEDFKQSIFEIIDSIGRKWDELVGWISGATEKVSSAVNGVFDKIGGVGDSISSAWDDLFGDDEVNHNVTSSVEQQEPKRLSIQNTMDNTEKAQQMISSYNSNPLNSGSTSFTSNRGGDTYSVQVAGATVNADGLTAQEAKKAFSSSLSRDIEMAIGQLQTGVDR